MKRTLTLFLVLFGLSLGTTPAKAYCIVNDTDIALSVVLTTYSPLGDFRKTIQPQKKECCDWFDRRCNPSGTRDAIVSLSVRNFEVVMPPPPDTSSNDSSQDVPEPRFNNLGYPDPNGNFDRYGVDRRWHWHNYDTKKSSNKPRPLQYQREVKEKSSAEAYVRPPEKFCMRGTMPFVLATGDGTITVRDDMLKKGGLKCESRDHFLRPVKPPSQATEFGVPMPGVQLPLTSPLMRRNRGVELN